MNAVAPIGAVDTSPVATREAGLRRLLQRPSAVCALLVVAVLLAATLGAPLFAPYSPTATDFDQLFAPPSGAHLFGTDELGRDLFTRTLYGGRTSIVVALAATVVAMLVGVAWGFAAALGGGWTDDLLMRAADLLMAMPIILLALVLVAAFGSSTASIVLIVGVLFAPATARIARASLLTELESDYYVSAVSVGASSARIVGGELLPNTLPVLIARASIVLAEAIFVEASLSFIGLGVQPPDTSWGSLLHQGYASLYSSYYYVVFPALVILIAVLALNSLGDNLQRAFDPSRA